MAQRLERPGLSSLALLLSLGVHAGLLLGLKTAPAVLPTPEPIALEVLESRPVDVTPPPPRATPAPTPPPAPTPAPVKPPVDLEKLKLVKAPVKAEPPPPNSTAPVKPDAEPPKPVAGLSSSSFADNGVSSGSNFGAGNTLMGTPPPVAAKPEEVKPYTAPPKPRPVELSEVGTAPVLLSTPRPEEVFGADYPPEARAQNIQGIASVRITIDEQGKVIEARAVRGPAPLRGPAEQLALRFRYKPATLNGSPVAVRTSVEIPFRLTD